MRISHRLPAVLAVDEIVHHARLQRTRPKQGHQRHDILEAARLEAQDQFADAARFELKHRRGACLLQQNIGRRIVEGNRGDHDRRLAGTRPFAIGVAYRPVDDGQGAQTEEVELHQTHALDIVLVELGHQTFAGGVAIERRKIGDGAGCDDHAARVFAGVARQTFELECHVPNFLGFFITG